jgi:hypothetical protein
MMPLAGNDMPGGISVACQAGRSIRRTGSQYAVSFIVACPFVKDSISLVLRVLLSQQRDSGSIGSWYMAEGDMFIEGF